MTVGVIVVAAGSGSRLGAGAPKAFVSVSGRTLLEHAVTAAGQAREVSAIVCVVPASHADEATQMLAALELSAAASVVAGGAERADSVAAGLRELADDIDIVLIHDAARAFTPTALFERVANRVRETGEGVIPVLPMVDTLTTVEGEAAVGGLPRDTVRSVQTPQGFPRVVIEQAQTVLTRGDHTDDAGLVRAAGNTILTVDGDARAFKITTPSDLERAKAMQGRAHIRVGTGTDTHAVDSDRPLWLAGLKWPGEAGLAGHSDGDAVCHAVVDALLGAAGLGDIGAVFGTDDPRYQGASGLVFLEGARDLLLQHGWEPVNVSAQILGNRPKLAPRRAEAEALLTGVLGAPVSLAATTTDGLGFTGRGEGVTVIATALVQRS